MREGVGEGVREALGELGGVREALGELAGVGEVLGEGVAEALPTEPQPRLCGKLSVYVHSGDSEKLLTRAGAPSWPDGSHRT